MKIIKPSVEIIEPTNVLEHIEKAYRVCYKSENLIKEGSAERIIKSMAIGKGHWSPTEHFNFIVEVPYDIYSAFMYEDAKFINKTYTSRRCVVSGSARAFVEAYKNTQNPFIKLSIEGIVNEIISEYDCSVLFENVGTVRKIEGIKVLSMDDLEQYELETHGWFTAKFICDRAIANEVVRHRTASYSQESTRYANYSMDKFGNEITVIEPCFWDNDSDFMKDWKSAMRMCESHYFGLIKQGVKPEEARSVLPNSLKTELIMTANLSEWRHFFELRCDKAAHPQMRQVAMMLLEQAHEKFPVVFDGIWEKYK